MKFIMTLDQFREALSTSSPIQINQDGCRVKIKFVFNSGGKIAVRNPDFYSYNKPSGWTRKTANATEYAQHAEYDTDGNQLVWPYGQTDPFTIKASNLKKEVKHRHLIVEESWDFLSGLLVLTAYWDTSMKKAQVKGDGHTIAFDRTNAVKGCNIIKDWKPGKNTSK